MCDRKKLKINVAKYKELVVREDHRALEERICMKGEEIEEVDKFKYLGVMINADGMGNLGET